MLDVSVLAQTEKAWRGQRLNINKILPREEGSNDKLGRVGQAPERQQINIWATIRAGEGRQWVFPLHRPKYESCSASNWLTTRNQCTPS